MYRLLRRFFTAYPLKTLFLVGLVLALSVGYSSQSFLLSMPAAAQDHDPARLVRDGVDDYQAGHYKDAIAVWLTALETLPPTATAEQAVVNANLARAYREVGDAIAAIDYWDAAAIAYQASGHIMQAGHMRTEQAQTHISFGRYQQAEVLLCGQKPEVLAGGVGTGPLATAVDCLEGTTYPISTMTEDTAGQIAALGSLAETSRLRGEYKIAEVLLKKGLALAEKDGSEQAIQRYRAPLLNSLGNTYARLFKLATQRLNSAQALGRDNGIEALKEDIDLNAKKARDSWRVALEAAPDQVSQLQSYLSQLSFSRQWREFQPSDSDADLLDIQQQISRLITDLPASSKTAYAAITLAKSYQSEDRDFSCEGYQESHLKKNWLKKNWLNTGLRIATQIKDGRAISFAQGELGHIEECRGNLTEAARLTRSAKLASNTLIAADSLYLWEWQMGRIYHRQNETDETSIAYRQAISTLESIRTEIRTANRDFQFDFRDTVEPIYRQYIEIQLDRLLAEAASAKPTGPEQTGSEQVGLKQMDVEDIDSMDETLKAIDALRLTELQNFFGNDCVLVASTDDVRDRFFKNDTQATVISSVVLSDRTALIANFPNGTDKVVWIENTEQLRQTAKKYRTGLKRSEDKDYDRAPAQALYDQLIDPLEPELTNSHTQTLVFVQDDFFRDIPMAALYDGSQYLVQRFAIATTPSLGLTASPAPRKPKFRALALGLSQGTKFEDGQSFSALNFVNDELKAVEAQLPDSRTLLDGDFTLKNLETELEEKSYPILHLATHGQFSTIPEDTFVVTGEDETGFSKKLTFGDLEALIREVSPSDEPIELITLTACDTAAGDDRATLGLAGVAIRSGARSAIASLWKVDDKTAAQFTEDFYSSWQAPGASKAKAIQMAQFKDIKRAGAQGNPGKWAPLVLVGSWQ